MNKRYFIVVYQSHYINGMSGTSQMSCNTINGRYLNCQALTIAIKKIVVNNMIADQVIITNIIELSEVDSIEWNKKYLEDERTDTEIKK